MYSTVQVTNNRPIQLQTTIVKGTFFGQNYIIFNERFFNIKFIDDIRGEP